jgi:hypothetical protein
MMKIILHDEAGAVSQTLETKLALWYVPPQIVQYKGEYYVRTSADDHLNPEFKLTECRNLDDLAGD